MKTSGFIVVSTRTVRSWLREGLKHSRIHGTGAILIKVENLDKFIERYEVRNKLEQISDEVLEGIKEN